MFAVDHFSGNVCNHGIGFTMCDAPYTWKGTAMDVPCTRCCGRSNDFYRSSWTTTRLVVLPLCSIISHADMYSRARHVLSSTCIGVLVEHSRQERLCKEFAVWRCRSIYVGHGYPDDHVSKRQGYYLPSLSQCNDSFLWQQLNWMVEFCYMMMKG